MGRPRWRKVLADLAGNRVRTLLVIASIAVGTYAVGVIAGFGIVVERDMTADFLAANPHSALISTTAFDEDLLWAVDRLPGVARAEGRSTLAARVEDRAGKWQAVEIVAGPPLDERHVDRLRLLGGGCSLADRQMVVERTGLALLGFALGDGVRLELPDGSVRRVAVAGAAHDPTVPSAFISGQIRAYVTPATMEWLGGPFDYHQVALTVDGNRRGDEKYVRGVARSVAGRIEDSGRPVYRTSISSGQPPMGFVLRGLMVLQGSMVVFLVVLSAFLVINTITALLAQQVRQIGVMKAVGARTVQIVGMYVVLVLGFGVAALAVAVPLAAGSVAGSLSLAADMMNFTSTGGRLPLEAVALQGVVALGVPVLAALVPVLGGTRVTIRQAIASYGLGRGGARRGAVNRLLERVRLLSRPTLLSLRNTFRRKGRLVLTLSTLALGGAVFIAVFNLRSSFTLTFDEMLGYYVADVNLTLPRPYRVQRIEQEILSVPGVERVEAWGLAPAQVLSEDKTTGVGVLIYGPPAGSTLIEPAMVAGRWLAAGDENGMVVCNALTRRRPEIGVGDQILTDVAGEEVVWQVVGICKMAGDVEPSLAYANYHYLAEVVGEAGRASEFRIVTADGGAQVQAEVAVGLEERFRQAGIPVSNVSTGSDQRAQQAYGINVFLFFLLLLASLIALVGGLGLAGTMSMNVLERTREIGVMRAIGASNGDVLGLVVGEGLVIGGLSWVLATVLAFPVSRLLSAAVGLEFLGMPMANAVSVYGFLIWLVAVLVLSALASLWPARNASRLTIREVLAYE